MKAVFVAEGDQRGAEGVLQQWFPAREGQPAVCDEMAVAQDVLKRLLGREQEV